MTDPINRSVGSGLTVDDFEPGDQVFHASRPTELAQVVGRDPRPGFEDQVVIALATSIDRIWSTVPSLLTFARVELRVTLSTTEAETLKAYAADRAASRAHRPEMAELAAALESLAEAKEVPKP